jgi:Zn-dependent protease with chaperone function
MGLSNFAETLHLWLRTVGWLLALGLIPFSYLVSRAICRLSGVIILIKHRTDRTAHWSEQARGIDPIRRATRTNVLFLVLAIGTLGFAVGRTKGVPPAFFVVPYGLAAFAGSVFEARRLLCCVRDDVDFGTPREEAARWLVLFLQTSLVAVLLTWMPSQWGLQAIVVLSLGAMAVIFWYLGGWVLVLKRFGALRDASPRVLASVDRAAPIVGVRPRRIFEMSSPFANALALPLARILIYSDPLLKHLNDDELASVTLHELAHLTEPLSVRISRLILGLGLVLCAALWPLYASFGFWSLGILVVYIAASRMFRKVARRMEERSDRFGRAYEPDPGAYARALEKISAVNLAPAVGRTKTAIHPHLYDRLIAAGITPSFERPKPPPNVSSWTTLPARIAFLISAILVLPSLFDNFRGTNFAPSSVHGSWSRAWECSQAAEKRAAAGDLEGARLLYYGAMSLDRDSVEYPAKLAKVCASLGLCEPAGDALREAVRRQAQYSDEDQTSLVAEAEEAVRKCEPPSPRTVDART